MLQKEQKNHLGTTASEKPRLNNTQVFLKIKWQSKQFVDKNPVDYTIICPSWHILKDNYRENAPSSKTKSLTKIINMNIWVIGTLKQLFIRGSYTEIKFSKR